MMRVILVHSAGHPSGKRLAEAIGGPDTIALSGDDALRSRFDAWPGPVLDLVVVPSPHELASVVTTPERPYSDGQLANLLADELGVPAGRRAVDAVIDVFAACAVVVRLERVDTLRDPVAKALGLPSAGPLRGAVPATSPPNEYAGTIDAAIHRAAAYFERRLDGLPD